MRHRHDPIGPNSPSETGEKDQDLFLRALESLEEVPDKDRLVTLEAPRRRVEKRSPDKRRTQAPQAVLDLHGRKVEEARGALTRFVEQLRREGERTALVITGKGLRSPGGVAVLKEELERWVRKEGSSHLEAYSEAPRALGGRGAYILYLRR